MPKPYGATQQGKVEAWIRKNSPTLIITKSLAIKLGVSRSAVTTTLRKLKSNGWYVKRRMAGRNTAWVVKKPNQRNDPQ